VGDPGNVDPEPVGGELVPDGAPSGDALAKLKVGRLPTAPGELLPAVGVAAVAI
jgi:hypothetical protein